MGTSQVEIVRLQPMQIASFTGFGAQPEYAALQKLLAWAQAQGLPLDGRARRVFGFNNPSPTAASPHYGYEFWYELAGAESESVGNHPAGEAAGAAPMQSGAEVKSYAGGLYAVIRCRGVEAIPDAWRDLVTWCEDSAYAFGSAQCLEQHIGALDGPVEELEFLLYQAIVG